MSYVVDIWETPVPRDILEAEEIVERLKEEDEKASKNDPNWRKRPLRPLHKELIDRLTAIHPCITKHDDSRSEDSPWSDGPIENNARGQIVTLGWVFSNCDETQKLVVETANKLGLVVSDPQLGKLYIPGDDLEKAFSSSEWRRQMNEVKKFAVDVTADLNRRVRENDWGDIHGTRAVKKKKSRLLHIIQTAISRLLRP